MIYKKTTENIVFLIRIDIHAALYSRRGIVVFFAVLLGRKSRLLLELLNKVTVRAEREKAAYIHRLVVRIF